MNDSTREQQPDRKIWERLLYMLFCGIAYSIAEALIGLIALFQFICVLVNGHVHERALRLGRNLSTYAFQVFQFVTFNDERVPFPFSDWPDEAAGDTPWRREEQTDRSRGAPAAPAAPADVEESSAPASDPEAASAEPPAPDGTGRSDRGEREGS